MSKQDGYASRTAADLERKYNFGKTFADVYGLVADARKIAEEAQSAYDGLTQSEIFNLLTDFGESQGVYRDDKDNVYINASYIKSGTISGDNVKVAAAVIEGKLTAAQIDAKDLEVDAANIVGTLKAGSIDTTNLRISEANITGKLSAEIISGGTLDFDSVDAINLTVYSSQIQSLSANKISAGTLDADNISLGSGYGEFSCGQGKAYGNTTYGAKMSGPDSAYYVFASYAGVRMQADDAEFYVAPNQVYSSLPIVEGSSDRRTKNSISYDMDKYERFFRDLKPCFFKYNTRPDEGYNLGFIAQDVEEALLQNELEKSDFTGLTTAIVRDENGEYSERYALILQQFVALNTHMIQNLNKRVEALEALNT